MAINVTKPSVNLREKLNELETNKGLKGNEILQAETAQEVRSLIGAGRKNLIINGGFDVWQRGTSATSYNSYASADRWKHLTYGAISKVSDGDRNTVLKMVTSTTSSVNYIRQYLEAPANLKGKTLTLSFWMKTSEALTTRVDFWLHDSSSNYAIYGKDGGVAGDAIALSVATTTSWAKYSVSVTVPTYTEKTDGTDKLEINVGVANSTAAGKSVYIDDVQLELGSVATDFEHRSYGEELALCQRYCVAWQSNGNPLGTGGAISTSGARSALGFGNAHNTSNPVTWLELPVVLRNAPTLTVSAVGDFQFDRGWAGLATYTNMSIQALRSSYKTIALIGSTTGLNNGDAGVLDFNKTTAYLILDAEL